MISRSAGLLALAARRRRARRLRQEGGSRRAGRPPRRRPATRRRLAGSRAAARPLKVAFAYVGPVGDGGWTYAHDKGRKAVENEFGDKVKTSFVENVPEAPTPSACSATWSARATS